MDLQRKTAFQTIDIEENESLPQFYARMLLQDKEALLKVSSHIVADAYFAKETFITPMREAGFHIVSRLQDDANLQYLFDGEQKLRGRKRKFDGKVEVQNLSNDKVTCVSKTDKERIYWLQAQSKSLKQTLNLIFVYTLNSKGKWKHKIYFSGDLKQSWQAILEHYRLRFQIEFLYRDAKQNTGLNDCQARSKNKLYFHWNMALTAINLAKIVHWVQLIDKQPKMPPPFSMSNVKTLHHNKLLLNLFFRKFGINPELSKNRDKYNEILNFGCIAA